MKNQVVVTIAKNVSNINVASLLEKYQKPLCITATRSMKFFAKQKSDLDILDFTEFQQKLNADTKVILALKEHDLKYILSQTIEQMTDSNICKLAFKNSISEIFELFSKFLIAEIGVKDIDKNAINKVDSVSSKELLKLYVQFLKNIAIENRCDFYYARNRVIDSFIEDYTDVVLYGFAFFNDLQNMLFKKLIRENKNVNIVINNNEFLLNDWLQPLFEREKISYEIKRIDSKEDGLFCELREKIYTNDKIQNESIQQGICFVEPFATRQMEFEYIAKEVAKLLNGANTREEIQKRCDNIAIVITNNFAKHTKLLNKIFREIGAFVSPDGEILVLDSKQSEHDVSGYIHLQVYQPAKNLFDSHIGRFVLEIYKIASRGMNVPSFNNLLSVGRIFSDKYLDCISEFAIIKGFFENINDINEWVAQIAKIKEIKDKITNEDDSYNMHPAMAIKNESLCYLENYIKFISNIITKIKAIHGTIKQHIHTLIDAIKNETQNQVVEVCLLNMFNEILETSYEELEYDQEYFSQNFVELISEYIIQSNKKDDCIRLNAINLESVNQYNIVFMPMFECNKYPTAYRYAFPYSKEMVELLHKGECIKKYILPLNRTKEYNLQLSKYVFQNLFRIAKEKIIFTRIDNQDGLPLDVSIFGNDIMNLCDIKQKAITKCKVSGNKEKELELIFKKSKINDLYLNELLEYQVCPKLFYYIVNHRDKMSYNDKFLLTFYARALILNKTFKNLAKSNEIYDIETIEHRVKDVFEKASNEIFENLTLFDENSKRDIKLTAYNQVKNYIQNRILSGQFAPEKNFKIMLAPAKQVKYKGIEVKTRSNIVIKDLQTNKETEFDISKALDYLVASSGGTRTEKIHFDDIIKDMHNKGKYFDRMHALNFLSFKVNAQLNSPKYYQDGVSRIQGLVDGLGDYEYSNLGFNSSSFCSYCKIKNICLEVDDE